LTTWSQLQLPHVSFGSSPSQVYPSQTSTQSLAPLISSFSEMQFSPQQPGIKGEQNTSMHASDGHLFHTLPVPTSDSSIPMALQVPLPHPSMVIPDKSSSPRTNPHHVLQTLRERPPSPMSIIPEATPELPQAPHINKTFLTREGTLKAPVANVEDDVNRQPRRLSAARAALTVSMYTMPRWLTLPLYLRCLVSTNSKHPYPYTHPAQLHPATRRRQNSYDESVSGSSLDFPSRMEKTDERKASRKKSRWIGKQKSQPSAQRV